MVIFAIIGVVILIAVAVTVAIVLTRTTNRPKLPPIPPISHAATAAPAHSGIVRQPIPADKLAGTHRTVHGVAVALTSADPIAIGQGISITLAPGWTLGDHGPNSVTLFNADSSAQMQVTVKPASGTDVVAVLQADINQLTGPSSAGLSNVTNLSGPETKTLQSANFQQQASIDYTATVSTQQGTIPVLGVFDELLNTSNHQSAFINFIQTDDATTQAANDGGMIIRSML